MYPFKNYSYLLAVETPTVSLRKFIEQSGRKSHNKENQTTVCDKWTLVFFLLLSPYTFQEQGLLNSITFKKQTDFYINICLIESKVVNWENGTRKDWKIWCTRDCEAWGILPGWTQGVAVTA